VNNGSPMDVVKKPAPNKNREKTDLEGFAPRSVFASMLCACRNIGSRRTADTRAAQSGAIPVYSDQPTAFRPMRANSRRGLAGATITWPRTLARKGGPEGGRARPGAPTSSTKAADVKPAVKRGADSHSAKGPWKNGQRAPCGRKGTPIVADLHGTQRPHHAGAGSDERRGEGHQRGRWRYTNPLTVQEAWLEGGADTQPDGSSGRGRVVRDRTCKKKKNWNEVRRKGERPMAVIPGPHRPARTDDCLEIPGKLVASLGAVPDGGSCSQAT